MTAFEEETFGPVAAITIADNVEHAIELANASDCGLGANLWTSDIARAQRIARRLETGGVFSNGFSATNARIPVGRVKKSGYGRELSYFGLREFTKPPDGLGQDRRVTASCRAARPTGPAFPIQYKPRKNLEVSCTGINTPYRPVPMPRSTSRPRRRVDAGGDAGLKSS